MWCDPPSISSAAEIVQPIQSNGSSDDGLQPMPSEIQEKKQLSFVYQPGIGLYDQKKINLDQDFRLISSTADVDERIQSIDLSPSPSTFNSDVDHRWSCSSTSSSSLSSIESPSPTAKPTNLYKSYLRRQNEQDSLPVRQKLFSNEVILSDKNHQSRSLDDKTPSSIELGETKSLPSNSPSNQENNHKRKCEQDSFSEKKPRRAAPSTPTEKSHSSSLETKSSTGSPVTTPENSNCEKDRLNEELNRQKAKLESIEEQRRSQQPSPAKPRQESRERLPKPAHVPLTKNTSMVKKSSETGKLEISTAGSTVDVVPSQGLLLCPKIEPIKKKKKKKIAPMITANTEALDVDDSIVDSILFDEMQSVQQQWQQLMMLSMEKELHIQPSEGKKKVKLKKFTRTNEFFVAYESLFDFDGMRHWCPTTR